MKIIIILLVLISATNIYSQQTASLYASSIFSSIKYNNKGIVLDASQTNTSFRGEQYTHIFFDEFGNIILSSLPQGRSNHNYVAHIFYKEILGKEDIVTYTIIGEGDFNPTLTIYNQGNLGSLNIDDIFNKGNLGTRQIPVYVWKHLEFLLPISTNNLKIDVYKNINDGNITKNLLSSQTIKMTPNFHVALNLGLLKSSLANPNFTLLTSVLDNTKKVVKQEEEKSRSQIAAFATFYYSPIKMIKNLSAKNKTEILKGRNFLDDDNLFERIYPTVGIKFGQKSLENFFYGFNWEIVRGGGIFFGQQYGRVNYYNNSDQKDFKFGSTFVTQDEFNIRNGVTWKSNWVFGATIDLGIANEFFKSK